MIRRLLPPALALAAIAATLWAYSEITLLRGTLFWEFRFLVLLVTAFLVLSFTETLLARLFPANQAHDEDA
ncbi:MAG: hypothetical protein NXH97_02420 [Rhodobacteraceae bacterium]|nr:hypothetical protein [Paracoccaceae bacterium]